MKYQAVVFDLFGTLVDIFSRPEYDRVLSEMAAALSIPFDDFSRAWIAGGEMRTLGKVSSPMGSLIKVCHQLRVNTTQAQLELASKVRLDYYSRNMKPRPEAVEVLTQLKARGCLTGLISNCASEIHESWHNTPFPALIDAPIFSCSVGFKKPDRRVFELAIAKLEVKPKNCLYVADGDSGELKAAHNIGMDAVRIRVLYETASNALRVDEEMWQGLTISSLAQVLELVGIVK